VILFATTHKLFNNNNHYTRNSAVAVIADRTYDVRYTGKLSNRFRL